MKQKKRILFIKKKKPNYRRSYSEEITTKISIYLSTSAAIFKKQR
jgi:hypothetical protein